MNKPTFEDSIDIINKLLNKNRSKWTLKSIIYMDYDDVKQIILIHIFKKWNQFDPNKGALEPWCNTIINNQILNIRRNVYDNNSRPCLRCAAAEGDDLCAIYEKQCDKCPLYARWSKTKKFAHDIRLPVSMENHTQEVYEMPSGHNDFESLVKNTHQKMKEILKSNEWQIYNLLFIKHLTEEDIIKKNSYTTDDNKKIGYTDIAKTKKIIIEKFKKCSQNGEIDGL